MTRTRTAVAIALVVTVAVASVLGVRWWKRRTTAASSSTASAAEDAIIPTSRVVRGSLDLSVHVTGDLRASTSVTIQAPTVGGTLRLLRMADGGSAVKAGDIVMEFDPTEQQFALEQAQSQLTEAEQQAIKMRADTAVQAAQDQVELLTARFDVRRAELDAAPDKDLVAAIVFQKHQIALDEAKHRLAQLETDASARAATSRASLAIADETSAKAKLTADRAQQNIDSLIVKSPISGMIAVRENRDASGGFFYSGMSLPEYRAGDNVFAGRPVIDVFDLSAMEIQTHVGEQERTNVVIGQPADVRFDSLPEVPLGATITTIAGLATPNYDTGGPLRQFDATLKLDHSDARLRPGASATVVITGRHVDGVLSLPGQALVQKDGKSIVYVRTGGRFEARDVKVAYRTESRVAIEGLAEGTEVALVDPESVRSAPVKASGGSAAGGTP